MLRGKTRNMIFIIVLLIIYIVLLLFFINTRNKAIYKHKTEEEELKEELKKVENMNKKSKSEFGELESENEKLKKNLETLRKLLKESKTTIDTEKLNNGELNEELLKSEDEIERLKKELEILNKLLEKYKDIIDLEKLNKEMKKEGKELKNKIENYKDILDLELKINQLKAEQILVLEEIQTSKDRAKKLIDTIENLNKEISLLEEELSLQDFGVYRPKYYFENIEEYKKELEIINDKIKDIVTNKEAVVCHTEWNINGSRAEGKKATNNFLRLLLRAFNSECDVAISKVKYNNINVMKARIEKAYELLNSMADKTQNAEITYSYLQLRLEELYLTHEYHEKVQEEKEEQRMIMEQMREEERAQKEYEKVQKEAEKEEERYQRALEKAQKELSQAHGERLGILNSQISKLKEELEKAKQVKERAISMAQVTKSGHVYVISNIGSFGEDVYKIGMTRRLEPVDRVRELGNASVPFNFDVHAMIYSENAPEFENMLHKEFEDNRVNKVNNRREFFRVELEKIEEVVKKLHGKITFTKIAEAEQYRKTLALINEKIKEEEEKYTYESRLSEIMEI